MVRTSVFADCVTRLIHGRVHVGNKDKQSRPDSSIQPFNLSHNHAHRETQRDPRLHLPISPHAFLRYATFPHMHYVTFPTCILALYLQTVRGTRCNTARTSILIRIFADLRRTRRDTCAAHLQTCEGTRCQTSSFNTTSAFLGVTLGEQHTRSIIA